MTLSERIAVAIITICVAVSIALIPKTIECAKMPVGEMPGYCLYLLPK